MKTCKIEGCSEPTRTRHMCNAHYSRWRRNGDPGAGKPHRKILLKERERLLKQGKMGCSSCGRILLIDKFYPSTLRNKRYRCIRCVHSSTRTWMYGLSKDQVRRMKKKQRNRCAICYVKFTRGKSKTQCCIDHDHSTGQVRGMICDGCNRMLGCAKDDIDILSSAIEYLERA